MYVYLSHYLYFLQPQSTRPRRLATWADEANESLQHLQSLNASERPKTQTKNNQIDSDQDTIPIIPDLEEVRDEEFVQQVASAPSVQMNKLASFNELNKDLMKHAAFSSLDGIDLTPLTQFCLPESQVKEDDVSWNWDYLISDVTSKLHLDSDSNKLDSH